MRFSNCNPHAQGFAYYDDIETPYEWGKLWMGYGDWLCGPDAAEYADPQGALEAYQAARDHFERMGAKGKLAEAEQRIAKLSGARIPSGASQKANESVARAPIPRRRPRMSAEIERRSKWAFDTFGIITANKHLLHLLEEVSKLARSRTPILVLGESGTGKELVAHAVHRLSERTGNFMPINCSTLPREVIESELFGFTQGAFTGATREKAGLLEVCHEGTVFLDEIGEMALELQSRLLRFLETGELRRLGSTPNLKVETRVWRRRIALATHSSEASTSGRTSTIGWRTRSWCCRRFAVAPMMSSCWRNRSSMRTARWLGAVEFVRGHAGRRSPDVHRGNLDLRRDEPGP